MSLEPLLQLIPPIATIILGAFSFTIRWLADFPLEGVGADFALAASSLQLAQIFIRVNKTGEETQVFVAADFIILAFLFAVQIVNLLNLKQVQLYSLPFIIVTVAAFVLWKFHIVPYPSHPILTNLFNTAVDVTELRFYFLNGFSF